MDPTGKRTQSSLLGITVSRYVHKSSFGVLSVIFSNL